MLEQLETEAEEDDDMFEKYSEISKCSLGKTEDKHKQLINVEAKHKTAGLEKPIESSILLIFCLRY